MTVYPKQNIQTGQKGFVLLSSIVILITLISLGLLAKSLEQTIKFEQQQVSSKLASLKQTKYNLLTLATYWDWIYDKVDSDAPYYGYLPCPDTNGNFSPGPACGGGQEFAYGYLPSHIKNKHLLLSNFAWQHPKQVGYLVFKAWRAIGQPDREVLNRPPIEFAGQEVIGWIWIQDQPIELADLAEFSLADWQVYLAHQFTWVALDYQSWRQSLEVRLKSQEEQEAAAS